MSESTYRLELPGDWVDFLAADDDAAISKATELAPASRVGLMLFRLPDTTVSRGTMAIEVGKFIAADKFMKFSGSTSMPPQEFPFWSCVWARIMARRINDSSWQSCFAVIPPEMEHNRCLSTDYVKTCTTNEERAYDLLVTDFLHLRPDWQINLTGRTYTQWTAYEREKRLGKETQE